MKYLIRIDERQRVWLYYGQFFEQVRPEGNPYFSLKNKEKKDVAASLWEWIAEDSSWTVNNPLDVLILADAGEKEFLSVLLQEAKLLSLETKVVRPTKWTEYMVKEFLEKKEGNNVQYNAVKKSWQISGKDHLIQTCGLYNDFEVIRTPKIIKKPAAMPKVKTTKTAFPMETVKVLPPQKPKVFVPQETAAIPKAAAAFPENAEKRNVQEKEHKFPEATDEQRKRFLNEQARYYVYTAEKKNKK